MKNFRVALFFHEDAWGDVRPAGEAFALPLKQRNLRTEIADIDY